ncbi:MAG: HEAT repeat domain-containing protein [Deltaproteobacteria bacterium]|nr:HEAT repeat domain-containing protein [Deltaproteobacteria bacterium]
MRRNRMILGLAILLAAPAGAAAAPMEHHDLASLWFLADEIVMGEEISHGTEGADWNEITTYRVSRSWKGELEVGAEIEVFDDVYRLAIEPTWDLSDPASPRRIDPPEREPCAILFLVPSPARLIEEGRFTREGLWMKVPSGMRILAAGKVYRFVQMSNPGAYGPVPQGDDPQDVLAGSLEPIEPMGLEAFEDELADAKAKAERADAALALTDATARNRALLDLLPPPRTFPPRAEVPQGGFPADALSMRLREEIARAGVTDDFLEAMGREVVGSFRTWSGRTFLEPDRSARGELLLAAALETGRARHQRTAALRVLADMPPWPAEDDENDPLVERLAPLLSDADPWVRAAAVEAVAAWLGNEEWKRTATRVLQPSLQAETDPDVLIEAAWDLMGRGMKDNLLDPLLRRGRRLVAAARPGPVDSASGAEVVLGYEFACRDAESQPYYVSVGAVATAADGREVRSSAEERLTTTTTTGAGRGISRFTFVEPLRSGTWQVALEVSISTRHEGPPRATATTAPIAVTVP